MAVIILHMQRYTALYLIIASGKLIINVHVDGHAVTFNVILNILFIFSIQVFLQIKLVQRRKMPNLSKRKQMLLI